MAEIFVKPDEVFTEEVQDRKRFERIQNTNQTESSLPITDIQYKELQKMLFPKYKKEKFSRI